MKIFRLVCFLLILNACGDAPSPPKPHAYPRLYFPEKKYVVFDTHAPYKFLIPEYVQVYNYNDQDSAKHPYWYNLFYQPFNATLHLSYHAFRNRSEFDHLFDDTRKLVYKHDMKAEDIEETEWYNPESHC